MKALLPRAIDLEIVQDSKEQLSLYQSELMSLASRVEMLDICDPFDLTIAVLEGRGSLTLDEQVVTLEPGMFVFIPARTFYTLRSPNAIAFLLNRFYPGVESDSAWIVNL